MRQKLQHRKDADLANALALVEQALEICDKLGLALVGLDLCAAAEKIKYLNNSQAHKP